MIVEGGRYEPTDSAFARLRFTVSAAPKAPADLLAMWKNKLPTYAGAILQALYEARGRELTRDEIGERIGRSTTSSSFDLAMKALKDNELISGERGVYSVGEVFR